MKKISYGIFLFSLFLLFGPASIRAETVKLKVIASTANVRLTPDMGSRIVGTAGGGTILESAERLGDWFKVTLPPGRDGIEVTGYIHVRTVEVQAGAPEADVDIPVPETRAEVASPPGPESARVSGASRLAIKIGGGFARLAGGDASANRTAYTDYWRDRAQQPGSGMEVEGATQSIHSGMSFEADVIYGLSSRLGVGLGVSIIRASKDKDEGLMEIRWPGERRTISRGNSFSAVPVKLGIFYQVVQGRKVNLFLNGGVGYYLAGWKELEDYESESPDASFWKKYETSVQSGGLGIHGGLGLEYRLSENMSVVLEGSGRYARISGFEGEYNEKSSWGTDATTEGTLYYYEWKFNQKSYPWVELLDRDPGEINFSSPIYNARKAVIDFSGFSLQAGVKISL